MPSARRSIDELVTLYQIEPTLQGNIYVEGRFDKRVLEWILHTVGARETRVYEIATVEVSETLLEALGLPTGSNRSRVIALAHTLTTRIPAVESQAAFIIDKDLDDYVGSVWNSPSLFRTDYTSLDVYLYAEPVLEKFLFFALRASGLSLSRFMDTLDTVLTNLFTIRLANASLAMNLSRVRLQPSCSLTVDGYIQFDTEDYLVRYLGSSGELSKLHEFRGEMERLKSDLPSDPRLRMHGHDLKDVLYVISQRSRGARIFTSPDALEAALLMALSADELLAQDLVIKILAWAGMTSTS